MVGSQPRRYDYLQGVCTANSDDVLSALSAILNIQVSSTTTNFFNITLEEHPRDQPCFPRSFPISSFDSWVTIGIEHALGAGEGAISILEEGSEPWVNPFEAGGNIVYQAQ